MGTACPVREECFHQPLCISSRGRERCLGTPHSVVQKKAPNPKMLSPEMFKTFLWKPNASASWGLQLPCPAAPSPTAQSREPGFDDNQRGHVDECLTGRPTNTRSRVSSHQLPRIVSRHSAKRALPPVLSTPGAQRGTHSPGRDISPQRCTGRQPTCRAESTASLGTFYNTLAESHSLLLRKLRLQEANFLVQGPLV